MNLNIYNPVQKLMTFLGFNVFHHFLYINWNLNYSMANNFTAFTHASLSVVVAGSYLIARHYDVPGADNLYSVSSIMSTGYFCYDMLHILMDGKRSKLNLLYLYHHSCSIYLLAHDPVTYRCGEILFWGELSNLPMYMVYYHLKSNSDKHTLTFWKQAQAIIYVAIRWPIISYVTYDALTTVEDIFPIIVCLPVYFMGIFWSINMCSKL